jgi:hypothetical protein
MAENIKLLEAQEKATKRLIDLQNQLNLAKETEKKNIQQNIDKIQKFLDKVDDVADSTKNAAESITDIASSISLSTRASDSLGTTFKTFSKQVKDLSRIQINPFNINELDAINAIQDAAVQIANAQQNLIASADGTTEEQEEAAKALKESYGYLSLIQDTYGDTITANKQLAGLVIDITKSIQKQEKEIQATLGLTEDELKAYKELTEEADALGARIKGIGAMITASLKKPMVLTGLAVVGIGKVLGKWGESVRSFGGYVDSAQISTFLLGAAFEDAEDVAKELSTEFGGLKDVSFATQLNTNLMAVNMGISGKEAANVVGSFARLNGMSAETAADMAATTKSMAKAAGVPVDQVMKDVAGSAETFAEYGKDGGTNIARAAVSAAKLGVNMSALTKVTDSLLDFETSINSELELGAMLGKNINLDRARALAYEGNIGGAVKETLQSLGGIEEFNKMDIFQKRKAAELLGLSVDEFQKMAANQDKLNEDGSIQLSTFDTLWESATAIATGPLASMVSTLGTGITLAGQLGTGFQAIGGPLKDMASSVWSWVSGLVKGKAAQTALGATGGASQFAGGSFSAGKQMLAQRAAGATPAAAATPAPGAGGQTAGDMNKMGKINGKALIQGAAAMLIMAAALYVMAKALQQFKDVGVEELGMAAGSLIVLGGALIGLSYALAPLAASGILFMVAAGMLALGGAVFLVGAGFKLFSEGVAALSGALPSMVEPLSQLSQINFLPILGLAASLGLLAVALTAVAVSGLLALPILAGLGLIAGGVAAVAGGGEGEGDTKTDELISEIKGLRADLNSGKIAVNIDGQKVTSNIGKVVSRLSTNSYAKT